MTRQQKWIREGQYLADVEIEVVESADPWAPYLSVEDARKLDEVRLALRAGDVRAASRLAKVYRLTPVTAA